MKIVLYTPDFHPVVGGLTTVAVQIADGLQALGEQVTVLTASPSCDPEPFGFEVRRAQSWHEQWKVVAGADVMLMFNVSLKALWLPLAARTPLLLSHHDHYFPQGLSLAARAKRAAARCWQGVAVSKSVNKALGGGCTLVLNPYDETVFRIIPGIVRDRDLIFVGRLVSEKGIDVLVDALGQLKTQGLCANLSVVGEGPERLQLERQVRALGLEAQVRFLGGMRGESLAREMNRHRVVVLPSRCQESFGLTVLEGIACGCVAVGNDGGGLPEAIGACGLTPRRNDVTALAEALARVLNDAGLCARLLAGREEHLRRHATRVVAERYRAALRACAGHA